MNSLCSTYVQCRSILINETGKLNSEGEGVLTNYFFKTVFNMTFLFGTVIKIIVQLDPNVKIESYDALNTY